MLSGGHRDFPGRAVVKTLCRGHKFDPWLGNEGSVCPMVQSKYNKSYFLNVPAVLVSAEVL